MNGRIFTAWKNLIAPFSTLQYLGMNVLVGIFITFLFADSPFSSWRDTWISLVWGTTVCFVLWTGNAAIVDGLDRRISWIHKPLQRALSGIVLQSLYSWISWLGIQIVLRWVIYGKPPPPLGAWIIEWGVWAIIISLGISFFFTAVGFFQSWRQSEKQAAELRTRMLTYQYEALRSQVNPHFLFNSFNVLTDLIYEDQEQAVHFVRQMSDLYRYVLDQRERSTVPLQEELDFIEAYTYLLKMRFEDKLEVQVHLEPQPDEHIVPMALQLLIENAVKHNEVSRAHPLRVTISREKDHLVVENPVRLRRVGQDSKGTGLQHLKAQYQHLAASPMVVVQDENQFTVRLPILKKSPSP